MRNTNFLLKILSLIILLGVSSCKKYGYEFEDGTNKPSTEAASDLTIDTAMSRVDRSMYAKARIFPGMVDPGEVRVKDAKFTLDLNFSSSTTYLLRMSVAPEPQFSTGYYAPAGELIKIVVPEGVSGLSVQVGGHTDNLTGKVLLSRDPIIYTVKQLFPGVNYVRNLYGGTIYIRATVAIATPVEFTITGAVVSPDFELGVTDPLTWMDKVRASSVPWLELRTKRVVFLIPRDLLLRKPILDPLALMTVWNEKFELDFNGWMGLSDNSPDIRDRSPQSAWRMVLDIQLTVGYGHSGFPVVAYMDDEWFRGITDINTLLHGSAWGTYHEFGHNCQQGSMWSWSSLGETTNNLFNFKVAHRNGVNFSLLHPNIEETTPYSLAFAESASSSKNFDTDAGLSAFSRCIPFIQIFEKYGYDAMAYLYTQARHAQRYSNNDVDKRDFVYERFSEYAQTDLKPFFDAWAIPVSAQSNAKISARFPLLKKKIWTWSPLTMTGGDEPITYRTAITVNSEELSGEGAVNGRAAAMIDGDNNTFWQSQWQGSPVGDMPYTIVLDVGVATDSKGMYFVPRNTTNGRPKNIEIFTSNDNATWTSVGTTVIPNAFERYNYNFSGTKSARYYKIIIKDNWIAGIYAAISELGLIK